PIIKDEKGWLFRGTTFIYKFKTCTLICDIGDASGNLLLVFFKDATSSATFQRYFLGNFQQHSHSIMKYISYSYLSSYFHDLVIIIISIFPNKSKFYYN